MIIRKATPADAAEIANVHISSWREAYVNLLPQDFLDKRPLNYKNRYELWKRVTLEDKHTTFVWVLEGNPSIQFYERTGARKAEDVKSDSIGGKEVVDLCYVWDNIELKSF